MTLDFKEVFKEILDKQDELNTLMAGEYYRENKYTTVKCEKKLIRYTTAIYQEASEFIDSFDWKHWKKGDNDIENAKMELLDIFFFQMSQLLVEHESKTDILDIIVKSFTNSKVTVDDDVIETNRILSRANKFFKKPLDISNTFIVLKLLGMSINDFVSLYNTKLVINLLRIKNGYAVGTYIKNWHGKEDNEVAVELLKGEVEINVMYNMLEEYYFNEVLV